MLEFKPVIAEELDTCVETLAKYGEDVTLLAGGTDLFVLMRAGLRKPRRILYIGRIAELSRAGLEGGTVSIGPTVTHSELERLNAISEVDCLKLAAGAIGSPQIRNIATAGGNLANGSPAADLYPALLTLGATVILKNAVRERELALEDFVKGPGSTALRPDEILRTIRFERPRDHFFSGFIKVGLRNALAVSVVNAAIIAFNSEGTFTSARIACGAVAPTPIRMRKVEDLVCGEAPSEELFREAAAVASTECDPLSDIRASKTYRCHVTGEIVSRLLRQASETLMGYTGEGTRRA